MATISKDDFENMIQKVKNATGADDTINPIVGNTQNPYYRKSQKKNFLMKFIIGISVFIIIIGLYKYMEKSEQLQGASVTQNIEIQKPEQNMVEHKKPALKVTWGNVNSNFLNLERKRSKTFELLMEKGKHKK